MATTISKSMSNDAILAELGARMREYRLRKNLTQEKTAETAGLAIGTIKNLETGIGTLHSLIAVLRALNMLQELDNVLPPPPISPMMMLKMNTQTRQRARDK